MERNIPDVEMGWHLCHTDRHSFSTHCHSDEEQDHIVARTPSLTAFTHTYTHPWTHVNTCTCVDAHPHFRVNKDLARDSNPSCLISLFYLVSAGLSVLRLSMRAVQTNLISPPILK